MLASRTHPSALLDARALRSTDATSDTAPAANSTVSTLMNPLSEEIARDPDPAVCVSVAAVLDNASALAPDKVTVPLASTLVTAVRAPPVKTTLST